MKISKSFNLEDFTVSQTAIRKNIDNTPTPKIVSSIKELCDKVLEPLIDKGFKFTINSGYRSPALNKAIGGAKNSQHVLGQAADLKPIGLTVEQFYQSIIKSGVQFDQIIQEFDSWVHVSFATPPRNQKLRATKENGKTKYSIYEQTH
jgi:zinc D-Ala-D-Ala carboxypeptidase